MTVDYDLVRSRIESLLTEEAIGYPVDYVNVEKSASLEVAHNFKRPWIRVAIKEEGGASITIGNNPLRRFYGLIYIQMFADLGKGTSVLRKLGTKISKLLMDEGAKADLNEEATIWIQTPVFVDFGRDETDVWYQCNLTAPIIYDMFNS